MMKLLKRVLIAILMGLPVTWVSNTFAEITPGSKSVTLEKAGGESLLIGSLEVSKNTASYDYQFTLNDDVFGDEFLSMRPFKCIDGEVMLCHLPYPYPKSDNLISDWVDLEYEFLFIVRSQNDYGIDPYNGRYFVLKEDNGKLVGVPHAVDLNILAAPPDSGIEWPITAAELDMIEVENERFSQLVIQ